MEDNPYTVPRLYFNVTNENKYMKKSKKSGENELSSSSGSGIGSGSGMGSSSGSGSASGGGSCSDDAADRKEGHKGTVTASATGTAVIPSAAGSASGSGSASACVGRKSPMSGTDTKNNNNNNSSSSSANSSTYHTATTSPVYPFLTPSHTPNRPSQHSTPIDNKLHHTTHVSNYTPPHTSHHTPPHTSHGKIHGDTDGWTDGQGSTWRNRDSTKRHHGSHAHTAHLDEIGFEEEEDEEEEEEEDDDEEEDEDDDEEEDDEEEDDEEEDDDVAQMMMAKKEMGVKEDVRRATQGGALEEGVREGCNEEWGNIRGANGTIKDPLPGDSDRGVFFGNKVQHCDAL
jgi:hypothetical protein